MCAADHAVTLNLIVRRLTTYQQPPSHLHLDFQGCLSDRLFRDLSLLRMVSAMLLEKQVVVISTDLERLTAVVHCASLLLRPLRWQCPLLPVLPHRVSPPPLTSASHLRPSPPQQLDLQEQL